MRTSRADTVPVTVNRLHLDNLKQLRGFVDALIDAYDHVGQPHTLRHLLDTLDDVVEQADRGFDVFACNPDESAGLAQEAS